MSFFGASSNPFSASKPATSTLFGGGATTTPGLFGASAAPTTTSFGGAGGFGGGGFGATTGAAASNPFGGASTSFGAQPTTSFGSTPFGGATTASSPFGSTFGGATTQTSNPFGTQPAATTTSSPFGGGFGSTQTATSTPFGSTPAQTASSPFGGFGATAPQTASSPFGGFGSTATGGTLLGGATTTASSPFGGGFGATTTTQSASSPFGGFGATSYGAKPTGTGNPPYKETLDANVNLVSISAMEAYNSKSVEELRFEDYTKKEQTGTMGSASTAAGVGASPFGATTATSSPFGTTLGQQTTSSPFGSTTSATSNPFGATTAAAPSPFGGLGSTLGQASTTSPFGGLGTTLGQASSTSSPFGNPGTAPASNPFGAPTTTSTTSPFGGSSLLSGFPTASQQPAATQPSSTLFGASTAQPSTTGQSSLFGGSSTPGLFGATQPTSQPATGSTLFGSSTPASQPGGLFGSQPATAQSTPGGLFGSTQPAAQTGLFGSTQPATQTVGLFGATQPTTQPTPGGLFGAPASTATSTPSIGLFGGSTAQPGGLFGATAQPATAQSTPGGLFGPSTTQPSTLFSTSQTPGGTASQPSLFGQTSSTATPTSLGGASGGFFSGLSGPSTQATPTLSLGGTPSLTTPIAGTSSLFGTPTLTASAMPSTGLFNTQPTLTSLPAVAATQVTSIPLNDSIASQSPYFPVQASPFVQLVKSIKSVDSPASTAGLDSSSSSSSSQLGRSTLSYHSYSGRPKIVPRRNTGFDFPTNSQPSDSAVLASQPSTLSYLYTEPVSTLEKFVSKYSKTLNINTSGETLQSLTPQTNQRGSGLYPSLDNLQTPSSQQSSILSTSNTHPAQQPPVQQQPVQQPSAQQQSVQQPSAQQQPVQQSSSSSSSSLGSPIKKTNVENKFINPHAPILTKPGYYTRPSLKELESMTEAELANVREFTVERKGYGSVMFLGGTDVRDLNIDDIVTIDVREVSIYPDEETKPPVGQGLNKRAMVTLQQCWPLSPDGHYRRSEADLARYKNALQRKATKEDFTFIEYDGSSGEWRFKVEHFSKYSAPDDFDEDEFAVDQEPPQQQQQLTHYYPHQQQLIVSPPPPVPQPVISYKPSSKFSANISMDQDMETELPSKYIRIPNQKRILNETKGLFNFDIPSNQASQVVPIQLQQPKMPVYDPLVLNNPNTKVQRILSPMNPTFEQIDFQSPKSSILKPSFNPSQKPEKEVSNLKKVLQDTSSMATRIKLDSKQFDVKVSSKDSIFTGLAAKSKASTPFMQRSFRVGWSPNGQFIVPSSTSIKTLNICTIPTQSTANVEPIVKSLKNHLTNSSVCSKDNRQGWFALTKVQEQLQSHMNDTHYKNIWMLVLSLWGAEPESAYSWEMKRKLNLNQWLKDVISPIVEKEQQQMKKSKSSNNYLDILFSMLSAKKLKESIALATTNKDFRLAIMMTQMWGSNESKILLTEQLRLWEEQGMLEKMDEKRIEIIKLLAGDIDSVYKNVSDWYRSFALNFWFKFSFDQPLVDVIKSYDISYLNNLSHSPLPTYLSNQNSGGDFQYHDPCYLLLKLFATERIDNFKELFYPENNGSDHFDYWLPWSLYTILRSLPSLNKQSDLTNQYLLHSSFASQLERLGLWQWSIYILSHIPDQFTFFREEAMKSCISRHIHSMKEDGDEKKFLVKSLLIPETWIDEAFAWYNGYQHKNQNQIDYLLKSGQFSEAHNLILYHFGPNYIISMKYDKLRDLLKKFQGHINNIALWKFGGEIFLNYLILVSNFKECFSALESLPKSSDPKSIHLLLYKHSQEASTFLSNLAELSQSRIIETSTNIYKISQSEMTKRLLEYCQQTNDLFELERVKLSVLPVGFIKSLSKLPITEDQRLCSLESLSQQCQDTILESIYSNINKV